MHGVQFPDRNFLIVKLSHWQGPFSAFFKTENGDMFNTNVVKVVVQNASLFDVPWVLLEMVDLSGILGLPDVQALTVPVRNGVDQVPSGELEVLHNGNASGMG